MGLISRAIAVRGEKNLHFVKTIDAYDTTDLRSSDHNTIQ
jgi:hypothetical protein